MPEYSDEFQSKLASEIALMGDDDAAVRALIDYGMLRAQLRECL